MERVLKNKFIFAFAALASALGLIGFAVFSSLAPEQVGPKLNASLAASANGGIAGHPIQGSEGYDLSAHQTLSRVILLIKENYVEPERIDPHAMFLAALDQIQKSVPEVIVDDTAAPSPIRVSVGPNAQSFDLGGLDQLWEVTMALRDIFQFLERHIDDPTRRRDIEYAAINGMLSTLDPHSVLLRPESFNEVKLSTKGEFGGLGIVISIRDASLTVISPIAGTPASRAGLKAKDKIVKIDEESTINMGLEEAVNRLRGKPGSKIAIWVLRENWPEPKRFILTRAVIKIESVNSKLLVDNVGYLRIKNFQNNTYDELDTHLERLRAESKGDLKGVILDLRNNPGGLLDQAILVSDRFIDRGPLVITVGEGSRKREIKPAHFSGTETDFPVAVLVNGGSASASEIVAGAIKNHDRGLLIGQQTFGKGSVQVLYDFRDKSALKLTIAQYLTPGDVSIQSTGITPDIEVWHASVEKENIHLFVQDDAPREKDLDKHLDRYREARRSGGSKAARITHLLEQEETDPDADPEKFRYDFEIKLARDILAGANSMKRRSILEQSEPLIQKRIEQQEARIARRLSKLGADWSVGEAARLARVDVSLTMKPDTGEVRAGQPFELTATVRNRGDQPLYRVYGTTESEDPFLNNLEFAFGKLKPGEQRSWKVPIKFPQDMISRADKVELALGDHHGLLKDAKTASLVTVLAQDRPHFAYTAQLDDRVKGNGDGVLQKGEKVELRVNVTNLGPGPAEETVVTVKNLAGRSLYLDLGRDKLGSLKVGESKQGTLQFTVQDLETTPEVRISVWDGKLGASVTESRVLPTAPQRRVRRDVRGVKVGAADVVIRSGADSRAQILGRAKAGAVLRSDGEVGAAADEVWRRVMLPGNGFGFVRAQDVNLVKSVRKTPKAAYIPASGQAPPRIALGLKDLVTAGDSILLQGQVTDEDKLLDLFVFVNEKKVFYRSLENVQRNDKGVTTPLKVELPLKEGTNAVAVVVRESDDVISRRAFGIYRRPVGAAVAERVAPTE